MTAETRWSRRGRGSRLRGRASPWRAGELFAEICVGRGDWSSGYPLSRGWQPTADSFPAAQPDQARVSLSTRSTRSTRDTRQTKLLRLLPSPSSLFFRRSELCEPRDVTRGGRLSLHAKDPS
jgi:hypothetical protein